MIKKIALFLIFAVLISALIYSTKYSLKYMHWYAKSNGYSDLYNQKDSYSFIPADSALIGASWKSLGKDAPNDGDIPNWPDIKEVSFVKLNDTIWFRYMLQNNVDINEPMVSIAFENENGREWYGTVNFKYKGIISAGYYRNKNQYFGYNFSPEETGICSFKYDLSSNSLFLGIPYEILQRHKNRKFIASAGLKGLWNDDLDKLLSLNSIVK